jgi:hypothetical protein
MTHSYWGAGLIILPVLFASQVLPHLSAVKSGINGPAKIERRYYGTFCQTDMFIRYGHVQNNLIGFNPRKSDDLRRKTPRRA